MVKIALFKPLAGSSDLSSVPLHSGYVYFHLPTTKLYFDTEDINNVLTRYELNARNADSLIGGIPTVPVDGELYWDDTTDRFVYYTNNGQTQNYLDYASPATTLAGYGIEDAKIESGSVILGENIITPVVGASGTSPIVASVDNTTHTVTVSHAASGVTAGTYKSVTVNALGHVTDGTNPSTLEGYGITDAQTTIASTGVLIGNGSGSVSGVAPNTTSTQKFLAQVDGETPTWEEISSGGGENYITTIGDGVSTTFTINHNLNTPNPLVYGYKLSTLANLWLEYILIDNNNISVTFNTPPAFNDYRIVVSCPAGTMGPGYSNKGEWVPGNLYLSDIEIDVVVYNGTSYYCKMNNNNTIAPNIDTDNWGILVTGVIGTGADMLLTGYTEPLVTSSILVTDTVNEGIGKLERGLGIVSSEKQDNITGAATTILSNDLTAAKAIVSNVSGKIAVSSTSATELSYLSGVTSSIQTQLNGKAASSHTQAASTITAGTFSGIIVANNNTSYTTKQIRNIFLSTSDPSGGSNGDIWIKYT